MPEQKAIELVLGMYVGTWMQFSNNVYFCIIKIMNNKEKKRGNERICFVGFDAF